MYNPINFDLLIIDTYGFSIIINDVVNSFECNWFNTFGLEGSYLQEKQLGVDEENPCCKFAALLMHGPKQQKNVPLQLSYCRLRMIRDCFELIFLLIVSASSSSG